MIRQIVKLFFQILCFFFFRKKRLEEKIIKELQILDVVIKEGHILASGSMSEYYLDIKKSFGYPRFLILYSIYIAKYIYKKEYTCIAVSGYGGIPIGIILSVLLGIKVSFIRDKFKKHGKIKTLMDGYVPDKSDRILVVDDVFTTGGSIEKVIISIVEETGAKIGGIFVIVNRNKNQEPAINNIGVEYILTARDLSKT